MSHKTPAISENILHDPDRPAEIVLDTPEWYAWLEDTHHCSFHFNHADGGFTGRKERKQRGQWYWVAYRQAHKKLYKAYLGRSDCLTQVRLHATALRLAHLISAQADSTE